MADVIRVAEEGPQVGSLSRNQLLQRLFWRWIFELIWEVTFQVSLLIHTSHFSVLTTSGEMPIKMFRQRGSLTLAIIDNDVIDINNTMPGDWYSEKKRGKGIGRKDRMYLIIIGVMTALALVFLGGFAYMGNKYWTRERPAKLTTEVPKTELPPWLTMTTTIAPEIPITEPPPGWDRCLEADCALAAGQILSAKTKNAEVAPCEDFYEFACGQWIHNNPMVDVMGEWSPMKKVELEVKREYMRSILEDPRGPFENRTELPAALEIAVGYFEDCKAVVNKNDYTSIHALLDKLIDDQTSVDLAEVLAGVQVQLGSNYFFQVDVELDAKDSGVYTVYMKRPKPGILPEYLAEPDTSVEYRRYVSKLGRIWTAVMGGTVDEGMEAAQDIIDVEQQLWNSTYLTPEKDGDRFDRYNWASVENLTALRISSLGTAEEELELTSSQGTKANPDFAYQKFFDEVFQLDYGVIKPVVTNVIVDDVLYFEWFNYFFSVHLNRTRVENYLKGKILLDLASDISLDLYNVVLDVEKEKVGAEHAETGWSSYCIQSTTEYFGMVLGAVYAKEVFPVEYQYEVETMFTNLKTKLEENIQADGEISESLKKHASEKLASLKVEIAHPHWIFNDMNDTTLYNLDDFYGKLELPLEGDHLANVLAVKQWREKRRLENFPLEADLFSWPLDPVDVSADYSPLTNTITLPAALFQSVWMVPNAKHITYGAIGSTVAREVVRAVGMIGLQYSTNGNLLESLDRTSYAVLEKRAQCYVDQYNGYIDEASGTPVKGDLSRDDNIIDSVGLTLAYQTYEYNFFMENLLPGVSHTAGELFFLSYAQMHCSRYKPEALKTLLREGRVPSYVRLQGAIANSPHFPQVWSCAEAPAVPCTGLWSPPSA